MIVHLVFAFLGFLAGWMICALLTAGKLADCQADAYRQGRLALLGELLSAEVADMRAAELTTESTETMGEVGP
jgi:hypothetical protein